MPVLMLICILPPTSTVLPGTAGPDFNQLAAGLVCVLGLVFLVGLTLFLVAIFLRAGRRLDSLLLPAGFDSEPCYLFGRCYTGMVHGRRVRIMQLPSVGIRVGLLDVKVQAALAGRAAIGHKRPLLDCRDCERLSIDDPAWQGLQLYARPEPWARRLVENAGFQERLLGLMGGRWTYRPVLYLQPEQVWMQVHHRGLALAQVRVWLDELLALVEIAESVA
jgi:hypothetical protein